MKASPCHCCGKPTRNGWCCSEQCRAKVIAEMKSRDSIPPGMGDERQRAYEAASMSFPAETRSHGVQLRTDDNPVPKSITDTDEQIGMWPRMIKTMEEGGF